MSVNETKSPIKSGWRGHLNGHIEHTDSHVKVAKIELTLDRTTAYALCNLLCDGSIAPELGLGADQAQALSNLGAAIGRLIDHPSANNSGRQIIK